MSLAKKLNYMIFLIWRMKCSLILIRQVPSPMSGLGGNLSRLNKRNGGGSLREGSDHHFHLQLLFDVAESIFNQLPSGLASFLLTNSYYSPLSGRR